ncbi:hypothetical protein LTR22_025329 [Elasticomyces elasticus]|nr:hypothetical protein LTR22_025329 [Elasticomyces elasticus]KAK4931842.1 hypothetical protein LTR49_001910 [Elasticomyces elasticus]
MEDSSRDELLVEISLLDKVEDRTSRDYSRAVRFCLSPTQTFDPSLTEGTHTRKATDNIVRWLYRHWKTVQGRAKRLPEPLQQLRAKAPDGAAYWLSARHSQHQIKERKGKRRDGPETML